ncbi:MAG TPA: hypothetical protein DEF51_38335 [Myxococcales bacterium]|nr:hypothetical protein [Myxococcales bacterium]
MSRYGGQPSSGQAPHAQKRVMGISTFWCRAPAPDGGGLLQAARQRHAAIAARTSMCTTDEYRSLAPHRSA